MAINFLDGISIDGLSTQSGEATALVINGSNVVGTRELGSNAFNSTTIPTNNDELTNGAGYTTNTGTTTASNSQTFTNKAGNISQWTNNSGYTTNTGTVTSANGSNNRVATFSSATALNGESALTFDGTTLETTGTMECTKFVANANNGFEFSIEGDNQFNMIQTAANRSMYFITAAGTGTINFGTNNTNSKVSITATGALKSTVSLSVGAITPSTTVGRIDASNDVVAFSTSDIRLKDNIRTIDNALDKVNSIQGIEFDWIEKEEVHGNKGHDIGVIAQEIEKILPDVVTTRDSGYKAVKYEKIVPLLIEAIKDLSKQVDGLKRLI